MSDREIMNAKQGITPTVKTAAGHVIQKPTAKDFARWLQFTLDLEADEMFGEFGYSTLTEEQQREVIAEVYNKGLLDGI